MITVKTVVLERDCVGCPQEGKPLQKIGIQVSASLLSGWVPQDVWDKFSEDEKAWVLGYLEGTFESAVLTWVCDWVEDIEVYRKGDAGRIKAYAKTRRKEKGEK